MNTQNKKLECLNLTKSFGGIKAVDDVSIAFESGKIFGLIGPNGAGKTTLFHLISGFIKPDHGEIMLNGKRLDILPPEEIARAGIGRLFQDVRVFGRLSVLENVLVAFPDQSGESVFNSIFLRPKVLRQERELLDKAFALLEFVNLLDCYKLPAENLSYGQQKLLAIARLLALNPDVFLLDEPTAGINPAMIDVILELIKKISGEGRIVIIIEHNMNVILEVANWVYFMNEGKIVAFGLPDEVLGEDSVRETYVGL